MNAKTAKLLRKFKASSPQTKDLNQVKKLYNDLPRSERSRFKKMARSLI